MLDYCVYQIDKGLKIFTKGVYPSAATVNNIYQPVSNDNGCWTQGFWVGLLWLAYEYTNDIKYKNAGLSCVDDFLFRIEKKRGVNHHDMGFLYSPSCVAAYKLTGNKQAKRAALLAADNLCARYTEKGKFIQAWGILGEASDYRLIIDSLLNLPLLFWAYKETKNERYKTIAFSHLKTAVGVVIRDDGTTFHTFFFDNKTGKKLYGKTCQGYSDNSIWARGQAWGIYGLAIAYKYLRNSDILSKFNLVTNVFFDHLPKDNIPAWDMIFTDENTQKDSSAAAIAICGINEMKNCTSVSKRFITGMESMLKKLSENYRIPANSKSSGILTHGVYAMPQKSGIDECTIWGDYYYMEALMCMYNPKRESYWE